MDEYKNVEIDQFKILLILDKMFDELQHTILILISNTR